MSDESIFEETPKPAMSEKDSYNLVSDTVTGVNVRWKDNLFQGIAILVSLFLGAAIGFAVGPDRDPALGLVLGGFCGLLVGLFGSGFVLMVFRGVRHMRGRHD